MKYLEQGRFVFTDESALFFFLPAAAISRRVVTHHAVKAKKARFSAGWRFSWSGLVVAEVVVVVYDGGRARFAGSTVGSSWLSGPLRRRWRVSFPPARVVASVRKNCEILRRFDETAAMVAARYWNAKPRPERLPMFLRSSKL